MGPCVCRDDYLVRSHSICLRFNFSSSNIPAGGQTDANDPNRKSIVRAKGSFGLVFKASIESPTAHSAYTVTAISRQRMGAPETESSADSRPYEGVRHVQKHIQKTVPRDPRCLDTCARYCRYGSRTFHCARSGASCRCREPIFLSDVQSQSRRHA